MKKRLYSIALILTFIYMLYQASPVKEAALNGLNLWLFTLVPTLLPFMFISQAILESGSYTIITRVLAPIMKYAFRLSKNCAYPFFVGLLCGLPTGAKTINDMYLRHELNYTESCILLSFCNNISPAFIISYLCTFTLHLPSPFFEYICFIMIASPIISGIIISRLHPLFNNEAGQVPSHTANTPHICSSYDSSILKNIESIVKLGCYIIIFNILSYIFCIIINTLCSCDLFFYLPSILQPEFPAYTASFLEITSGLSTLRDLSVINSTSLANNNIQAIIKVACTLTSFGGICSIAQTKSMISCSSLPISYYIIGKLSSSVITFLLISILFCLYF